MAMKLVFMGTPAFALPALEALIHSTHDVVAVYTQPPRPSGRGKKTCKSPIHELAEKHAIPVYTPPSLKEEDVQKTFANHQADIAVVAAYGLLLPEPILTSYPHGCINIHPSLLPRWRGAAPIQRTIMAGDKETGVCIMRMDKGLDTGDVLMMEIVPVTTNETTGSLHDQLADLGARLTLKTLDAIEHGLATYTPQVDDDAITYANKITRDEECINWGKPATEIDCLIRGLNPHPGAYFTMCGERIKILAAELTPGDGQPGEVLDDRLTIACVNGAIRPTLVKREGKQAMDTTSLLCGCAISPGTILD